MSADQKALRNQTSWRDLFRASPGLGGLLATDALATLAELAAAVVVPWWITTLGGTSAIAAYGIAMAGVTLIVVPAVSPFGDRFCKAEVFKLVVA